MRSSTTNVFYAGTRVNNWSEGLWPRSCHLQTPYQLAPGKGAFDHRITDMTGELSLTGQVLAIGGVREKVIAARRQKIFELILPEANRGDFAELPDYLKDGLTVHFAKRYADVAKVLFG